MRGRVCLVTGGTSGVGKAIATGLAELGATVVVLSRDDEKGARTVGEIQKKTGTPGVFYRVLDLEKFERFPDFIKQFENDFRQLHVLSNNAAVLPLKSEWTQKGLQKIFAVNYLSHFLLTVLFLKLLKLSAPARVLTVSGSPAHLKFIRLDPKRYNPECPIHPIKATLQAAAAKVAFSYELSKKVDQTQITSNTFHPGLVKTRLGRQMPGLFRFPINLVQPLLSERCETGVFLASSPDIQGVTGQFFNKNKIVRNYPWHKVVPYSTVLWEKSKEWTGLF